MFLIFFIGFVSVYEVRSVIFSERLVLRIEITFSMEFLVKIDRWSSWENY